MLIACFRTPAFGIACERARHPEFSAFPVALLDPDTSVRILSEEASSRGVQIGQTASSARSFCRDLIVLPYDLCAYEAKAAAMWDRLAVESSSVEPVSPELCYIEFRGPEIPQRLRATLIDLARIARTPIHVGMASSKSTAHIAALRSAPGKAIFVERGKEPPFLASTPVGNLSLLDVRLRDRLSKLGIRTLGDIHAIPERDLHRSFHEKAMLLRRMAIGADYEPVAALWPEKSIERSMRLEHEIDDEAMLHAMLRTCARHVSDQLSHRNRYCRRLELALMVEHGEGWAQTEDIRLPLNAEEDLFRASLRLLQRISPDRPLVGVRLKASAIGIGVGNQLALLDDNSSLRGLPHERRSRLETACEQVRRQFGPTALGAAGDLSLSRPFQLWTYPLTRRLFEQIEVATDQRGNPMRYRRRGEWCDIAKIQNRWSEADWREGRLEERMVYRVETPALGLTEMCRCGSQWSLTAIAD